MSNIMTTEEKVLQLKKLAIDLHIQIIALNDPDLDTYINQIRPVSVKKIYGVYVSDGYLPLNEFLNAEKD